MQEELRLENKHTLNKLGKKFWIPVFALLAAALIIGTFSIVRAITSSGDATWIDSAASVGGYEHDGAYPIYYGTDTNTSGWKPWSTRWYKVTTSSGTSDAMCLEASLTTPSGSGTTSINHMDVERIMLATVPSYSEASVAAGGPDYYTLFANSFDWSSYTSQITNLMTRDTNIVYASNDSRANINSSGEEIVKYTDYYYGCSNYYNSSCNKSLSNSEVNLTDAIFAMGHMMASGVYSSDYFGLTSADISVLSTVQYAIDTWFDNNYPNATDEYQSYTTFVSSESNTQSVGWLEYSGPTSTEFRIHKTDTNGNDLSGATFAVYYCDDVNCRTASTLIGTYATTNGYTDCISLDSSKVMDGYVRIRFYETVAPPGYKLDSTNNNEAYAVGTTCSDGTTRAQNNEKATSVYVKINKFDAETLSSASRGSVSVVGSTYGVYNSAGTEVASITIGSDGTGTSNTVISEGTNYYIQEKSAATGYTANSSQRITFSVSSSDADGSTKNFTSSSTACSSSSTSACYFTDSVIKGRFSLSKTGYELGTNGSSSSRNLSGIYFTAVNKADSSISYTVGPTASDGSITSPEMVYGNYTVTETRSSANSAYNLLSFDVSITNSSTSALGTKLNEIPDTPSLSTVARNSNSTHENPEKELEISGSASVTDRITCSGLQSGSSYKISGEIWNKTTGAKTSSTGTSTFTADSSGTCGNLDMLFSSLDTSALMGNTLGIKQYLYKQNGSDWILIAMHNTDLSDTNEQLTVRAVEIKTTATTSRSNNKQLAVGKVTITDRIELTGLTNGVTYQLRGTLKDASGNTITLSNGDASKTESYTMASATGATVYVNMDLEFDSSNYIGGNIVVFETVLTSSGTELAKHESLSDTDQTVSVLTPSISTVAVNGRDGSSKEIEVGNTTIVDTVTFSGLSVGSVYRLEGELWDVATNTKIGSTASTNFTASSENGNTNMTFNIDTSTLVGKQIVVYEYLYYGNNKIAEHVSSSDADQTVTVRTPTVDTTAVDNSDNDKLLEVGSGIRIKDTVAYDGLIPNDSYTLVMKVVKRSDPSVEVATGSKDFQASDVSGTVDVVSAVFNSSTLHDENLRGLDLVVFEYLYHGSTQIAKHEDKDDDNQIVTVRTPTVETTAVDNADGDKLLEVDEGVVIKDTVTYDGLVNDDKYTLKLTLRRKDNPDTIISSGVTRDFSAQSSPNNKVNVLSSAFDTTQLHDANFQGLNLVVYEELYYGDVLIATHEDSDDEAQTVTVKTPTIATTAYDAQNHTRELPLGTTTIIDEVRYTNLVAGKEYKLKGTLMNKTTGEPVKNASGNAIVGEGTFTASDASGSTDLTFSVNFDAVLFFDYSAASQPVFVAYEELYKNDVQIAEHKDINDDDQSISINRPTIKTKATWKVNDDMTQDSNMLGVGDVIMKDYIEYEGLVEGEWYTVIASIYNPETGATLEIDDESVENSKTFKADSKGKGTVAIEINLNTISLQGKSFVVYERLYRAESKHGDGRLLDIHEEALNAGTQTFTVKVASIGTTASDKTDGDNVLTHEEGQTINDVVHYDGLLMDEEYTLYGYLWDKTNNKPLLDTNGKRIESFSTFTTPRKSDNGDVTVEFAVDATDLPGAEIVVLEYLFSGGKSSIPTDSDGYPDTSKVVTKHEDLNDANQTVKVSMRVGTTAADFLDGDQEIGVGDVKVVDKMKYEGAKQGETYKAKGWLVNKEDGLKAKSVVITCSTVNEDESEENTEEEEASCTRSYVDIEGEQTFVVGSAGFEETTGIVSIEFEFDDRELIGKELVVFEELYLVNGNEETLVAEHKDLSDAGQTITVATPEIRTIATDALDGDKELLNDADVMIRDQVEYKGLVPGTLYTLNGVLVDRKTGERLSGDAAEATYTFEATRESGTESIEFTINTSGMNGREIVVFETLYLEDEANEENKLAEHKDLEDGNQTVWVKTPTPSVPNTGLLTRFFDRVTEPSVLAILGGLAVVSTGIYVYMRLNSRRKMRF
ncbi:VaFE repeat-containing surface-anchored protein [Candidatus Saccharibacteria bacterium]|nr:VaFE repeat-containing surface-anchored protein [Candidatus Saccharibacteria bacterium]